MGHIQLKQVKKTFGEVEVIPPLDLQIEDGEFVVFVGSSGYGKSTLLRLIAGPEDTTSGKIEIDGADTTAISPTKRGLAVVFQSYALYPHKTVRKNIAFPMRMVKMDRTERNKRIEATAMLNLADYLDRKSSQLSDGQRQRAAFGRPMAHEPLSNLESALPVGLRLAEKIVVLQDCAIEQFDTPLELYRNPRNLFVAGFIGSPKVIFIERYAAAKHSAQTIGIRPEHIDVSTTDGTWQGAVGVAEYLGSDTYIHILGVPGCDSTAARAPCEVAVTHGETVFLTPDANKIHKFGADGLRLS